MLDLTFPCAFPVLVWLTGEVCIYGEGTDAGAGDLPNGDTYEQARYHHPEHGRAHGYVAHESLGEAIDWARGWAEERAQA